MIKQGATTSRFVVQDKVGLKLIALLFNGNMVLPTRSLIFHEFLTGVNTLLTSGALKLSPVVPLARTVLPTLFDA